MDREGNQMAQYLEGIDRRSFALGMINAFAEVVAAGVKPVALSPPIDEEMFEAIRSGSDAIVADWKVTSYVERELLETDLFPASMTDGITVILYAASESVLAKYLALKSERAEMVANGEYEGANRHSIAMQFGRLLGYSEKNLEAKLA
jgi:hypothetical protein